MEHMHHMGTKGYLIICIEFQRKGNQIIIHILLYNAQIKLKVLLAKNSDDNCKLTILLKTNLSSKYFKHCIVASCLSSNFEINLIDWLLE